MERMADVAMHTLDLTKGAVLERGCVYIAEIQERLKLPQGHIGPRQSEEFDGAGGRLRPPADRLWRRVRRRGRGL